MLIQLKPDCTVLYCIWEKCERPPIALHISKQRKKWDGEMRMLRMLTFARLQEEGEEGEKKHPMHNQTAIQTYSEYR